MFVSLELRRESLAIHKVSGECEFKEEKKIVGNLVARFLKVLSLYLKLSLFRHFCWKNFPVNYNTGALKSQILKGVSVRSYLKSQDWTGICCAGRGITHPKFSISLLEKAENFSGKFFMQEEEKQ